VFGESLQAPNNTKPTENTLSNSYFARFNQKSQNMNLTIYLKTIGRNVDPSARIPFLKTD
jgi:hypothetical protein